MAGRGRNTERAKPVIPRVIQIFHQGKTLGLIHKANDFFTPTVRPRIVNCADRTLHFDCAVARYLSRGVVREFVHRFKYDRHFYLRHPLTDWLAETLDDERIRAQPIDALVPVPLHSARFREREFNQADVLAELLAARTGTPLLRALDRIRYTTTQTRLDRHERMENLRNAFRVRHTSAVQNRHLVLVDDIFTTGSTVDECARVLRAAGAASVRVVTVARG